MEEGKTQQQQETYVVQVPKDQIYRLPPPENARIAQQRQTKHAARRKKRPPWFIRSLCSFLCVLLFLSTVILVVFLVARPGLPAFTVQRLACRNRVYSFMVKSRSPSKLIDVSYVANGTARLVYNNVGVVAEGEACDISRLRGSVKEFDVTVYGLREITKSFDKGGEILRLSLRIRYWVRLRVGGIRLWKMRMEVVCAVNVSGLGKTSRVLSQKCKSNVRII